MTTKTSIVLFLAACALSAQDKPKPTAVLSNEAALELQLLDSQQKTAVAPYQTIVEDLQAVVTKLKAAADTAVAPITERRNALILDVCKKAGIGEEDVKAQRCLVNPQAKTVTRAPDPKSVTLTEHK